MRLLLLKHFDFDDPFCIASWAAEKGYDITVMSPPDGFRAPSLDTFELLVILGGPMSAYHDAEHPWLTEEKSFIRQAVEEGKKVLGICLGAQMLSEALGGRVYRSEHKEIGWHPVKRLRIEHPLFSGVPEQFYSFHWHGDCFDIPEGAVSLAYSDACRVQAFAYGEQVLGLQFHLETTASCMTTMLDRWHDELADTPFIQKAEQMVGQAYRTEHSFTILKQILSNY
ncbi:type 1 glutamine amidotransferase [Paenibacillus sp. NPDC056579]|uniref:type 1 glutamine amidotransferase n=1 Tax=unclassified Paenibacillus TaxID=185978 RepID=UPI001EF861BE|nr:type 1 glutamine amidotransferase [Paenibacillus sp. H1-7]ULL14008.1 type 1 glutamine amidotransferase [Paenibacillus sp. H1-7]